MSRRQALSLRCGMPQCQKSSRISFPTTHLILAEFDVLAVNREAVAIVARHGGQIPPKERCKQNLSPMSRVQVPCRSVVASLEVPAPSRSPQKGGEYNTQFHSQDSPSEQEVSTRDSSSPYGGSHIVVLTVYVNSAKRPPRLNLVLMRQRRGRSRDASCKGDASVDVSYFSRTFREMRTGFQMSIFTGKRSECKPRTRIARARRSQRLSAEVQIIARCRHSKRSIVSQQLCRTICICSRAVELESRLSNIHSPASMHGARELWKL